MKRDLDLLRQIMRDVEELQHQFQPVQSSALRFRASLARDEPRPERRRDRATATTIAEALRMRTAFGVDAASRFILRRGIASSVAERILAGRHDQRQVPDRRAALHSS